MKPIFFFTVLFLFCHAAIAQDTLQLIPKKWSFADGNGRMTKTDVLSILDTDLHESYLGARKKIIKSEILGDIAIVSAAVGSICLVSIRWNNNKRKTYPPGDPRAEMVSMDWLFKGLSAGICFVNAIATGIPSLVLRINGKSELQNIADTYNSRRSFSANTITIQPSVGVNTAGITLYF